MPAVKRTKEQREKDLAEMSELLLEGWTHQRLGEAFGVTKQQITYDVKELNRRWKAEQLANTDERKLRRHNELELVKRRALAAFTRSEQEAETLHAETTKGRIDKRGLPLPDQIKTTKTVKAQSGDAALLGKYLDAVREQIDLWGDGAPKNLTVDLKRLADEVESMTDDELRAVLSRRTDGAGAGTDRAAGSEAAGDAPDPALPG